MESFLPSEYFTITNGGKTATFNGSGQKTVYGSHIISFDDKKIYKWNIHINKMGFNNDNISIGIDDAAMKNSKIMFSDKSGYGYVDSNSIKANGELRRDRHTIAYVAGQTVTMKFDISKKTLIFSLDNEEMYKFIDIKTDKQQKYRMAVGAGRNSSVTLTDFIVEGDEKSNDIDAKEKEQSHQQTQIEKANNNSNNAEIVDELLNKIQGQNKEIIELQESNTAKQKMIETQTQKEEEFTNEIQELQKSNAAKQKMIETQTQKEEKLTNEIEEYKTEIQDMEQQLNALKYEKERAEKRAEKENKLKAENDALKQENANLNQKVFDLEDERKEYEMRIDDLKKEIKSLKMKSININEFREWDEDQVLNWIFSIEDGLFVKYEKKLNEEIKSCEIKGIDLLKVDRSDIKQFGVSKFSDQKILQEHIEKLKEIDGNINIQNNNNNFVEGNIASTAYISH